MRGLGQVFLSVGAVLFLITASAGGRYGSAFLALFFCILAVLCLLAARPRR